MGPTAWLGGMLGGMGTTGTMADGQPPSPSIKVLPKKSPRLLRACHHFPGGPRAHLCLFLSRSQESVEKLLLKPAGLMSLH